MLDSSEGICAGQSGFEYPATSVPFSIGPEVGFEPTTFRLRVGCSASIWTAPDGSSLLTLDASSVQTAPDGYRRIVWMIKRMIKGIR